MRKRKKIVKKPIKIMLLDDDPLIIKVLKNRLNNYFVTGYNDHLQAIEHLKNEKFDILIIDYYLISEVASSVVKIIRQFDESIIIILLSGFIKELLGKNDLQYFQFLTEKDDDIESFEEKIKIITDSIIFFNALNNDVFLDRDKNFEFRNENPTSGELIDIVIKVLEYSKKGFVSTTSKKLQVLDISEEELYKIIKKEKNMVKKYLSGEAELKISDLIKIANHFQIPFNYFLPPIMIHSAGVTAESSTKEDDQL